MSERAEGVREESGEVVLFRCQTPTDFLCPCGAVARRLRRLEVPYRTERVPYRRSRRPEVVELTGQSRVPLLVDGEEVVNDSKRIIEYLEWRHGSSGGGEGEEEGEEADEAKSEGLGGRGSGP
jgi:hypothetical protein